MSALELQPPKQELDPRLVDARRVAREGMLIDALAMIRELGPLDGWTGVNRIYVSRIIRETGAPRLALWHDLKAFRECPELLAVRNVYASEMLGECGPLDTLEFLDANAGPSSDDQAEDRAHWMWLRACCHGTLRDFGEATEWLEKLAECTPDPEDSHYLRAYLYERQDRYDDALASIEQALEIKEAYRQVQYKSHLLTLVGRDDEAFELLSQADQTKQSGAISWQMSVIAYERRDFVDCERLLQRFEELIPLRERAFADAFLMFRSELARRLGDDAAAIEYGRRSRTARGREIAEMLQDPARREAIDLVLEVPFVRQHEMTCGPATLASISRYWEMSAAHLEVAEEICYAGTSTHNERKWSEENGFATREFTVDADSTEVLIGRGVPFTLVTRGAGYAHLQSVIGYDGRTATILIRDPYHRSRGMASIEKFLESQAAHGPRGMVLVPLAQRGLIDDVQLPDSELYDLLHHFDGALIQHDRETAIGLLDQLRQTAPDHRITLQAERQLGIYDGNEEEMLAAIQKLLKFYPKDSSYQQAEISLLGSLGRVHQRRERLAELVAEPDPHPLLLLQYGELLAEDGRTREEAESLIRKSIRLAQTHSRAYLSLADLWFARGDRERALPVYKFAACLESTDEYAARCYFDAAIAMGRTDAGLNWLRNRFERYAAKSAQPMITLVDALLRVRNYREASEAMETALSRRPDDAEVKLYVAQTLADLSSEHWPRAWELLEQSRSGSSERRLQATAAHLCVLKGDLETAREHWQTLLERSPLSVGVHEEIARLTADLDGPEAEIEHWRRAADHFPHYIPLLERYAMALRERPLEVVRPVLDKIIAANTDNAWAIRELAQHVLSAGRLEEAQSLLEQAQAMDSDNPFIDHLRSMLAYRRGESETAKQILRAALERDINDESSLRKLINMCETAEESRAELRWFDSLLRTATVQGEIILGYRDLAMASSSGGDPAIDSHAAVCRSDRTG